MKNILKYIVLSLILIFVSCINSEIIMENDNYRYWIQKYDYSSQNFGIASVKETIKAFNNFNWALELSSPICRL